MATQEHAGATLAAGGQVTGSGTILKYVPEKATIHWRFGWIAPNLPTFSVDLAEVRLTIRDDAEVAGELQIAFTCPPEVYAELESWTWFGLDQGLAQQMGVTFLPDHPVRMEVRMDPDYAEGIFTFPLDPSDPEGTIRRLMAPLFDREAEGTVHQPSAFVWERVVQETGKGVIGFTRSGRIVDLDQEAEPPAGLEPETTADEPGVTFENFEMEPQEAVWAEPMCPTTFELEGGPVIDLVVERIRLVGTDGEKQWIDATFQLAFEDYLAVQFHQGFGLTADAVAGQGLPEFDESLPVYVDAQLNPDVAATLLEDGRSSEDLVRFIVDAICDEEFETPLCNASSWTFTAIQQQPEGQSFRIGYRNRNLS